MVSRKTRLIGALVATLAVFLMVKSICVVVGFALQGKLFQIVFIQVA
jgi:hypothetical protein